MSVIAVTFEDVTSHESWDIPCECKWHKDDTIPAEWIVRHGTRPCGCCANRVTLWCDPCLTAVTSRKELLVKCHVCGHDFILGEVGIVAEPIHPEAA